MKIVNVTSQKVVVTNAKTAKSFFSRFKGLMLRKSMDSEEALIFYRAPAIHSFFMFFAIDLVFLNRQMKVIKICPEFKPARMAVCFGSYVTLELVSGRCRGRIRAGDVLELVG